MKRALMITVSVLVCFAIAWGVWQMIYHAPILHSETSTRSMAERDEEYRYLEWCNEFSHYLTGRLCDYYQLYPQRFKPTGTDEEIEIEGFTDFVRGDGYFHSGRFAKIRGRKILDPWGDPVHFVQDLNMDGFINARGQHGVVSDMPVYDDVGERQDYLNEHRLGMCKENLRGIETQPREIIFVWCYHHAKWWPNKTPQPAASGPSASTHR